MQRSPEQLLAFLPSGKTITLPETASQCKGIIWLPSSELDVVACKMVEMGEAVRLLSCDSDSEAIDQSSSIEDSQVSADSPTAGNDSASQRKLQKKLEFEFARLAKRVRLEALKVAGVHSIQIWSTALRMMIVSRSLLLEDKDRAIDTPSEVSQPEEEAIIEDAPAELATGLVEHGPANDSHVHEQKPEHYRFMENIMMSSFYPSADAFEAEWPAIHELKDRANGVSNPTEDKIAQKVPEARTRDETPATGLQAPTAHHGKEARNSSGPSAGPKKTWLFGLPLELWRRVIADAVGADGILSRGQQIRIMRYAADWDVLAYKLTIQGVEDYQQVWKFLETVSCFTYSQLT